MRCVIGQSNELIEIIDGKPVRVEGPAPEINRLDFYSGWIFIKDMTNRFETGRMNDGGTRIARGIVVRDRRFGFYFYFSISRGALSAGSDG